MDVVGVVRVDEIVIDLISGCLAGGLWTMWLCSMEQQPHASSHWGECLQLRSTSHEESWNKTCVDIPQTGISTV